MNFLYLSYETKDAAGCDIRANLGRGESLLIKPGERVLVPTGLAFAIEPGYEVQVRPRSGLSYKTGLTCCEFSRNYRC
jgi:dUTP pyrophosphatase